ncbi:MAG: hypothetical protein Q4A05_07565 [Ruminococcus sp.]|nr:hypothetical protein [Ruminococcus sp.]
MKILLIVLCVLLLIGMLALDAFLSRDMNRPDKKDNDKDEKETNEKG